MRISSSTLRGAASTAATTQPNRRAIKESRTRTTRLIGEAIIRSSHPPRIWMNASTATIYRDAYDRAMDEATGEIGGNEANAPSTWRFSIDVATSWEEAFFSSPSPGTRKIALRSAMVMSPDPRWHFRHVVAARASSGLGGASGSGKQFVSWIHDQDFLRSIDYLIAHEDLDGAINIASPNPSRTQNLWLICGKPGARASDYPPAHGCWRLGAVFLRTETELILEEPTRSPRPVARSWLSIQFPGVERCGCTTLCNAAASE